MEKKGEIMKNFILEIPKWEGQISFSNELVTLILVVIALVAGVLLCFWGYRYFQTIALVLLGCLCGKIGYQIGESMTGNEILKMCIFVIFAFFGVCMCYCLSIIGTKTTKGMGIQTFLHRTLHIIASLAGALIVAVVTYTQVYRNLLVVILGAVILAVAGIWYGNRNLKAKRVFHTYDDLSKLEPLTEEKANA